MRFVLAIVAVAAACGGHEVSPSGPAPRPSVRLVRCQPATPPPVIVSEAASDAVFGTLEAHPRSWIGDRPRSAGGAGWGEHAPNVEIGTPTSSGGEVDGAVIARVLGAHLPALGEPWTPFALDSSPPLDTAPTIARATEGALRARMAAIEACFTGPAPTGSLRAMLELDAGGGLTEARVGGLGDRTSEACVAKALDGMHVVTPTADAAEVACDLSRGDAQPWRIAPDAGYQAIAVSRTRLVHGTEVVEPGATEPDPLPAGATYLVVADADAPGTMIELALSWAAEGDATLIALRDGARAPALIGAGRSMYSVGDDYDDADAVRATLEVGAKTLTACVHSTTQGARLGDPAAIGSLLSRVAARCRKIGCAATLGVAVDGAAVAHDLVEVMAAARRAGFERVLIGGFPGCRGPRPDRADDQ